MADRATLQRTGRPPRLKRAYSSLLPDGQRRVLTEVERHGGEARSADVHRRFGVPLLEYHLRRLQELGVVRAYPTREDPKHRTMEITPSGQMILLAEDYSITYRELGVLKRTVGESELFQG